MNEMIMRERAQKNSLMHMKCESEWGMMKKGKNKENHRNQYDVLQ